MLILYDRIPSLRISTIFSWKFPTENSLLAGRTVSLIVHISLRGWVRFLSLCLNMHFAFYVAAWFKSGGRGERERHIKVHWLTLLCTELCSMFSSVWENEIKKVPFWRNYNCKTISARAQLEEINSEPIQKYLLFALHMPWLLRSAQAENLPDLKFLQQYPSYFDLGSGRNSGGTKWAKFSLRSKHLLEAACCCQYLQSVKS